MKKILLPLFLLFSGLLFASPGDTLYVKTFSFDSISTRRGLFDFPESNQQYGKILMYYTLKCDEATPHDKYPCGEWDYTTYSRIYLPGEDRVIRKTYPSWKVKNSSPKQYFYSDMPTWSVYSWYENNTTTDDLYLCFDGDDYLAVPDDALSSVKDEFTASFWVLGDKSQPRADAIFEATDINGERVINLHVPYDNGVLYFDAGGYGQGKNDNVSVKLDPLYYKGVWTHYAVTKNNNTGMQKIYRNGILIKEQETGKKGMNGITSLTIGARDNKNEQFYAGGLDEIMMWNRELTQDEIKRAMYPDPWELPAEEALLIWYPVGKEGHKIVIDKSGNEMHATAWGVPQVKSFNSFDALQPKPQPGQRLLSDSVTNAKVHIVMYDDSLNPSLPTDTLFVYPGYRYHYTSNGLLLDSAAVESSNLLQRKTRIVETKESTEEIVEIARFITPYGKRLDLGLNGFTWVYDVTPYAPLLKGAVDLQAGNGQELIDLRFAFIEGMAEKDPIDVRNVYPFGSHTYEKLANDEALSEELFRFNPDTKQAYIRARISGHGHAGPKNCCEWDPKTHFMLINGDTLYDWIVWRDCGMNPVHPQGGTWQFDRAGWCPGTFVDTYDFKVPDSILSNGIASFDYSIQPYDPDNGEEKGNYEISIQVMEFGVNNFEKDASIEAIIAPSDQHEFKRYNPVSTNPIIRIKNCGTEIITSMNIKYGMTTGKKSFYQWTGEMPSGEERQISLPAPSWKRMKEGEIFIAEIKKVNGRNDPNPLNNVQTSMVDAPVILPEKFIVEVETQDLGRSKDNKLLISDQDGNIVFQRDDYPGDTTTTDVVELVRGSYQFVFSDENEDGMIRHWWNYYSDKTQVGKNGALRILNQDGELILDLGFDWAEKRQLNFFVGKPL